MKKKGNLIGLIVSLVVATAFQVSARADTISSEGMLFYLGITLLTVVPVVSFAYFTIKEW